MQMSAFYPVAVIHRLTDVSGMKMPGPSLSSLLLSCAGAALLWLLDGPVWQALGMLAAGSGYAIFYAVILPRKR